MSEDYSELISTEMSPNPLIEDAMRRVIAAPLTIHIWLQAPSLRQCGAPYNVKNSVRIFLGLKRSNFCMTEN